MADFDRPLQESEKIVGKFSKTLEAEGKKMDAQWRLWAATTKSSATSVDYLGKRHEYLAGKLKLADDQVVALSKQYEIMAAKPGTTAASLAKMSVKVDEAKVKQANLRAEVEKIDAPLERYAISLGAVGDRLTKLGGNLTKYVTAPMIAGGVAVGAMVSKAVEYGDKIVLTLWLVIICQPHNAIIFFAVSP
jgi:chromosome segregation ATPase